MNENVVSISQQIKNDVDSDLGNNSIMLISMQ